MSSFICFTSDILCFTIPPLFWLWHQFLLIHRMDLFYQSLYLVSTLNLSLNLFFLCRYSSLFLLCKVCFPCDTCFMCLGRTTCLPFSPLIRNHRYPHSACRFCLWSGQYRYDRSSHWISRFTLHPPFLPQNRPFTSLARCKIILMELVTYSPTALCFVPRPSNSATVTFYMRPPYSW